MLNRIQRKIEQNFSFIDSKKVKNILNQDLKTLDKKKWLEANIISDEEYNTYTNMLYFISKISFIIICCIVIFIKKSQSQTQIQNQNQTQNKNKAENETENQSHTETQSQTKVQSQKNVVYDVLFIYGASPDILNQVYRYRILHEMEQLNVGYLTTSLYYYENLHPHIISNFRIIIFSRCPWTKKVGEAISLAKSLNKVVFFEIDDLVFDTKYTKLIPYIQKNLSPSEKLLYVNGVLNMGKTLKLCEGAITTTKILAKELKNYVQKVFINYNVPNEEMWKLSFEALESKKEKDDEIIIGYFSGSITHNYDFEMIKPVIIKILHNYKNVKLFILGFLELSDDFKKFSSQIIMRSYIDWKELPKIMSNIHINLAPLENNFFNSAKSEIKWVEAALVKVPTIASNIGSFKEVIINKQTGILCSTNEDWYNELKNLITNQNLRKNIAENAFNICKEKYNTLYTGHKFATFINSVSRNHIGFILPTLDISGGVKVALIHASFLKKEGYDVDLIVTSTNDSFFDFEGNKFTIIGLENTIMDSQYDILVGTLYSTLYSVLNYNKVKRKIYLVQGYETDFYSYGIYLRQVAEKTYSIPFGVEYITTSKWCEKWLKEKYNKNPKYAPNGINFNTFTAYKRNLNKDKIRILIEGDNTNIYKNVDESFKIVEKLDKNKYEIWYMSYNGNPKSWYRVNKFLSKVPYEKVKNIYKECDILIKTSLRESFSYPPLEMMATGGYCIVLPNNGNLEYLKDEENCLFYKKGDIDSAVKSIERLIKDKKLQKRLYENGLNTAKQRDFKNIKEQILNLYKE